MQCCSIYALILLFEYKVRYNFGTSSLTRSISSGSDSGSDSGSGSQGSKEPVFFF